MNRRACPLGGAAAALAFTLIAAGAALAAPKIFVDPTEIDLGVIEEGKLFERYIEVKNVGDGTLVVEDLKTSCGCTAAAVDKAVDLTAGVSQKVRVTFNTKGMDGSVHKSITITTNDPEQPTTEVRLTADVHRAVRVEPKFLELRDIGMKDTWEKTVRLESDSPLNVQVREAYILGGRLRNEPSKVFDVDQVGQHKEGDRDITEFAVRLRSPALPQKLSEILQIVTDQEAPNDTLRVVIRGDIVGRIRTSSSFLVIRTVKVGETGTQDFTLSAAEGTFKVLSAQVLNSPVKTTVFMGEGNKQAVVKLEYTGTKEGENGVRTLVVETDDPDQKQIEVPVRYSTSAPPAPPAKLPGAPATDAKPASHEAGKKKDK